MKLETSQDLLNRVRARHHASWYGLQKLLGTHKNTVYSWKGGHTVVDRKFAPRIAELLDEPAEYVLACLEADREHDAEVLKVWERIATKFRGHAASIVLATMLVSGVGSAAKAEAAEPSPSGARAAHCMLCEIARRMRRWRDRGTSIFRAPGLRAALQVAAAAYHLPA